MHYERAKASGKYERVERHDGAVVKHYALTNPMEYFAELSESYFGVNDFFPFNREQLEAYDPKMFSLLERVWKPSMKITGCEVYQVDLPLVEGNYSWSEGKSVDVFDSTVVKINTDSDVFGFGEVCPLGPVYLPAYAAGARAGIAELFPQLIGEDPTQMLALNHTMDRVMKGHPYVKSAIDMACWDIVGKLAGMPVCHLLGGRFAEDFVLYRAISQRPAAEMAENVAGYRAEGYRRFQLKVGGRADDDIERIRAVREILEPGDKLVADANTGWLMHDAMRVVGAVSDLDVYIEQPCLSPTSSA